MYIFDPTQFKEFGFEHYQGDGFYYRYQTSKRFFFRSIYIPLGPSCESEAGFENFIKHLSSLKMTKIKIDLPTIYNSKQVKKIVSKLESAGFKKSQYIQDEETIFVLPEDMNLPHSEMTQVRYGLKRANIVVKDNLTEKELQDVYNVYKTAADRLSIAPKDIAAFKKLAEKCLVSLAYNKDNDKLEGFLLNYFTETDLSEVTNQKNSCLLLAIYTGLTDEGRKLKLGRAIYYELFRIAFEKYNVDVIDFHGASRKKGRSYMGFKESFSKRFIDLPGSFEKINLF